VSLAMKLLATCSVTNCESHMISKSFIPIFIIRFIPTRTSYSTWLLLALNEKQRNYSIRTPYGLSSMNPTPLPFRFEVLSTDKIPLASCMVLSLDGTNSFDTKFVKAYAFTGPLLSQLRLYSHSSTDHFIILSTTSIFWNIFLINMSILISTL